MEIVIVDDEPVSLAVMKQLVGKLPDCKARAFAHASAALAWCDSNDPDVVIVDYMMPELNGIEFSQRLRAVEGRSDTPLLMVTANAEGEVRDNALESGVNEVLNKPFDAVDLQARVSSMLALRYSQKKRTRRSTSQAAEESASPTSDTAAAERLLDHDVTLARLNGDTALLGELVRIFLYSVPPLLSSIDKALRDGQIDRVYAESHSLKGAVAAVEASLALQAVTELETHARNRAPEEARAAYVEAQALVQRLASELSSLIS